MRLKTYTLKANDDGTFELNYDYEGENGKITHVNAPRVSLDYDMEKLKNMEDIIFPNIKGHTILNADFEI